MTPPNSTRVNSALAPILMDSGSRDRPTSWASGAIGANTTAPAVAKKLINADTVDHKSAVGAGASTAARAGKSLMDRALVQWN